ncbi:hypothetical protein HOE22_09160 [Candidatus Woesearchaeota archaeon]|jgi:hypothetical protein|nr:hypothetical protein [Candidatus Woesearchaeota archaeon]
MAMNNVGAASPIPKLQIPKQKIINDLNLINPLEDDLNGGPEQFRWGRMTAKEKLCMWLHEESFKNYGLLNGFVVVKVPKSFTANLDGQPFRYKKGTYITIDFNGRLRTLKDLVKKGKISVNEIPISDVSQGVLKGATKMDDDARERMWDAVVTLSTGGLQWDMYQFLASGAELITDKTQREIFTYFVKSLKLHSGSGTDKMTNRNVILSLLGRMPSEEELRRKKLNYDLRYKRYSRITFDKLSELRSSLSRSELPATFVDELGKYLLDSANRGYFLGYKSIYNNTEKKFERNTSTDVRCFPLANGTPFDLYSDEHFSKYEEELYHIMDAIELNVPDKEGYPSDVSGAKREIHKNVRKEWIRDNK